MSYEMIISAISAFATVGATIVALWVACTEYSRQDKHRRNVLLSQPCDLILIPTKEWGSGAYYQKLIGEMTGYNRKVEAVKYASEHQRRPDLPEDPNIAILNQQADAAVENSLAKKYFVNENMQILTSPDLFWIDSERIYGVNIKPEVTVSQAYHDLIVTQYFKAGFITRKGRKHDKEMSIKNQTGKIDLSAFSLIRIR